APGREGAWRPARGHRPAWRSCNGPRCLVFLPGLFRVLSSGGSGCEDRRARAAFAILYFGPLEDSYASPQGTRCTAAPRTSFPHHGNPPAGRRIGHHSVVGGRGCASFGELRLRGAVRGAAALSPGRQPRTVLVRPDAAFLDQRGPDGGVF